jgi:hypothetical protein
VADHPAAFPRKRPVAPPFKPSPSAPFANPRMTIRKLPYFCSKISPPEAPDPRRKSRQFLLALFHNSIIHELWKQ